jgi:hypothetical protein|tara:strand:- start:390 stop:605 length:216 start_codon:yes stop_codon:yes gene_type:complete
MTPREAAQIEAEKTFEMFILWSKRVTIYAIIFLMIVVFGCNSGVETGPNKTGSQYDGEVYSPMNLNNKVKK